MQKQIKKLTIHLVNYLNLTEQERQAYHKQSKLEKKLLDRKPYNSHKWFGLIPMMLRRLF